MHMLFAQSACPEALKQDVLLNQVKLVLDSSYRHNAKQLVSQAGTCESKPE